MNLTHLRHVSAPADERGHSLQGDAGVGLQGLTPSTFEPRLKLSNRSPKEEAQARMMHHAVEPVPNALAALILARKMKLKVTRNGFKFRFMGEVLTYWDVNARSCHPKHLGQEYTITFDRDNLDCIHVLDGQLRYVETLPRKGAVAPWGKERNQMVEKNRAIVKHTHEELKRIHNIDELRNENRHRKNAEALQAVNTFPVEPARPPATDDTGINLSHRTAQTDDSSESPTSQRVPAGRNDRSKQAPSHGNRGGFRTAKRLNSSMEQGAGRLRQAEATRQQLARQPLPTDDLLEDDEDAPVFREEIQVFNTEDLLE